MSCRCKLRRKLLDQKRHAEITKHAKDTLKKHQQQQQQPQVRRHRIRTTWSSSPSKSSPWPRNNHHNDDDNDSTTEDQSFSASGCGGSVLTLPTVTSASSTTMSSSSSFARSSMASTATSGSTKSSSRHTIVTSLSSSLDDDEEDDTAAAVTAVVVDAEGDVPVVGVTFGCVEIREYQRTIDYGYADNNTTTTEEDVPFSLALCWEYEQHPPQPLPFLEEEEEEEDEEEEEQHIGQEQLQKDERRNDFNTTDQKHSMHNRHARTKSTHNPCILQKMMGGLRIGGSKNSNHNNRNSNHKKTMSKGVAARPGGRTLPFGVGSSNKKKKTTTTNSPNKNVFGRRTTSSSNEFAIATMDVVDVEDNSSALSLFHNGTKTNNGGDFDSGTFLCQPTTKEQRHQILLDFGYTEEDLAKVEQERLHHRS